MNEVFRELGIRWPAWPEYFSEESCLIAVAKKYSNDLEYRKILLASMPAKSKEFASDLIASNHKVNGEESWEKFALGCLGEELKIQTIGKRQCHLREIYQNTSLTATQNLAAMGYFSKNSYLTLAINCLTKILSDDNVKIDQKQYSILHLVNSFSHEWHLREAQNNEGLADGIIRFFKTCACRHKIDIRDKEESIRSIIGNFDQIREQLEEFDDWIHMPLHLASINIKNGNISEAINVIQDKLSSSGITKEESAALAHSYASKLAMKLGSWDEVSNIINESKSMLNEYKKNQSLKNSILPILHAEVGLLSHELSIALANKSLEYQGIQNGNHEQKFKSLSRSQLGQDLWVLKKRNWIRNGYFVEFGATDGVLLSNSWLLEKHFEWNGICAEPNPKFLKNLKINRACNISNKCVFSITDQRVEFVLADVYGGIKNFGDDDSHKEKRDAYANNSQTIEVETISLVDLLKEHNAPLEIDYLSIDTEGSEFEILNAFDWEAYSIKCITVEHNYTPMRQQIRELLTSKGYACEEARWDDWYFKT